MLIITLHAVCITLARLPAELIVSAAWLLNSKIPEEKFAVVGKNIEADQTTSGYAKVFGKEEFGKVVAHIMDTEYQKQGEDLRILFELMLGILLIL